MERIVLEVDDITAKAWRNTSAKLRTKISKKLEQVLNDSLNMAKEANFELLLQNARTEAAKNGLSEEILTQLLSEENQTANQGHPDHPDELTYVYAKRNSSNPA